MIPQKTTFGRIRFRFNRFTLAISEEFVKWSIPAEDSLMRRFILQKLGLTLGRPVFIDVGFNFEYGHNIKIGQFTFLRQNAYLGDWEKINIGMGTTIARNLSIYTGGHSKIDFSVNVSPVSIGNFCWIGANVTLLPGTIIGNDCIIASGSIVTENIPDQSVAAGIPAKIISKRIDIPDVIYTGFGNVSRSKKILVD